MNKTILIALGSLLASAAAARDLNETLDAHPKGRVVVFNMAGDIEVEGWSRNSVEVTGELGEDVDEFVFERDGREIEVRVRVPDNTRKRADVSSELTIRVPKDSSVEVSTVSADIEIRDVRGEQELQAVSGDVDTEAFAGDIDIGTVSGDIDIVGKAKDANVDLVSVSGDIVTERLAGSLSAEAVSGDIDIDEGSFDKAQIETVNGDVHHRAVLRKGGKLNVKTVNGDVDITFSGRVSASFDIETFNGSIDNCFGPKPKKVSRYTPGRELSFTAGDGDGRVAIATLNGDLDLCKE